VGAGAATASALRLAKVLRTATSKSSMQVLNGVSRHERRRITEEVIRLANPGISNSAIKQFIRARVYPRRFTSVQISNGVRHTLTEAAGAAVDISGSAVGGLLAKRAPTSPELRRALRRTDGGLQNVRPFH
jgi:hypothetical protein